MIGTRAPVRSYHSALLLMYLLVPVNCWAADTTRRLAAETPNMEGLEALYYGHLLDGIEKVSEALAIDPKFDNSRKNLACAHDHYARYLMKRSPVEALKHFHQAKILDQKNPYTIDGLAATIRSLSKDPGSFTDRVELGDSAQLSGDLSGAVIEYDAALKLKNESEVHKKLVDVTTQLDQRRRAFELLMSWVSQLNEEERIKAKGQKPKNIFVESNVVSPILVRNIDDLIEQLDDYHATSIDKATLRFALNNMTSSASTFFEQHSRIRKKETNREAEETEPISVSERGDSNQIPSLESETRSTHRLSTDDLKHGEDQVTQMIHDRPAMARYVLKGDPIWNWCARQFAGECTRSKYYWNGNESDDFGLPGWHKYPGREPGQVCVRSLYNPRQDGDELWSSAIFELFNIRNDSAFVSSTKRLERGRINHHQWVRKNAQLEYLVARKLPSFHREYWKPQCDKLNVPTYKSNWNSSIEHKTFEQWFQSLPADSPYLKLYGGR